MLELGPWMFSLRHQFSLDFICLFSKNANRNSSIKMLQKLNLGGIFRPSNAAKSFEDFA
jgi:hypothetical protein